jgi:hypothetical protein
MIVPEHSANYRLAQRSKRHAVQVHEKCDIFSRKKYVGYLQAPPAPRSHWALPGSACASSHCLWALRSLRGGYSRRCRQDLVPKQRAPCFFTFISFHTLLLATSAKSPACPAKSLFQFPPSPFPTFIFPTFRGRV